MAKEAKKEVAETVTAPPAPPASDTAKLPQPETQATINAYVVARMKENGAG